MADTLTTITPVDGSVYVERTLATAREIDQALDAAHAAQQQWKRVSVGERAVLLTRAVDAFVAEKADIAAEISWQMGRPVAHAPGEVNGFVVRARYMIAAAE